MPTSTVLLAKRALVSLLLRLAVAYQVVLSINRDASVVVVTASFRKVVLKVHPDKGGRLEDAQELQAAKAEWDQARKDATSAPWGGCMTMLKLRRGFWASYPTLHLNNCAHTSRICLP